MSQEDALRDQPGENLDDPAISVQEPAQGDDGLPADIVGRGAAGVKAELESRGYTVKTEKRLSSKKYVGKVSGSISGPGSKLSDGQTVTLCEGRGFDGWGEGAGFKCEWGADRRHVGRTVVISRNTVNHWRGEPLGLAQAHQ